jgi:putative cardiolipin synthase
MYKTLKAVIALSVLAVSWGCASIDFDYPRSESYAIEDTADTSLGRFYDSGAESYQDGTSGFHVLGSGIDALAARIALAEHAERTIDVQYYLIKRDATGTAFIESLLRAADRGVRVRVLLDDVFTRGYDVGMVALDHHPEIEIRIFNPFNRGAAGRALGSAKDFRRVNRRMHNKSFTVDNQVTIIGGRNIADEYFAARRDVNFGDLDVVCIGPIVEDVSSMFDLYWNHEAALPVPAFSRELDDPDAELERVRGQLATAYEQAPTKAYGDAVRSKYSSFLDEDEIQFEWAPYRLVYDSPDKGLKDHGETTHLIKSDLYEVLGSATDNVIIVSPYFVPLDIGVDALSEAENRGIDVTVITNSLAANNQFSVHAGYGPSRKPLLRNGVNIYEVKPDAQLQDTELVAASGAKATLHTKAFIVDHKEIYIGSFNFDPRSARLNTEMGVLIEDPAMAGEFVDYIHGKLPTDAYDVFLNEDDDLRWRAQVDGVDKIYDKEPETSWWDRFVVGFVRLLPIRGQL